MLLLNIKKNISIYLYTYIYTYTHKRDAVFKKSCLKNVFFYLLAHRNKVCRESVCM